MNKYSNNLQGLWIMFIWIKKENLLLSSFKQNYFIYRTQYFFDKILRHPKNRYLNFFVNLRMKIVQKRF